MDRRFRLLCSSLSAALVLTLAVPTSVLAQKRALTLEDLYRVQSTGDAQVTPDGRRAIYTVTVSDLPHAKRTTHIWMADLAGGPPRQITQGDNSESSPAVSPNGKTVAFIRSKDGESNLYLLP